MKKRLLLILAIGISFAPLVFADGGAIGAFTRSDTAGQSFCQAGITRTKNLDNTAVVKSSASQAADGSSQSDSID